MIFTIFRTLLILTHFLCDLFSEIRNSCLAVHRKCCEIFYGENIRTEIKTLVKIVRRTGNLPKHIVIVYGTKEDTIVDCIQIIGWCITLGIPYISFFDSNGFLSRNESILKLEVAKRRPDLVDYINWGKCSSTAARNGITNMSVRNGTTGPTCKVNVLLLSPEDGKGEIVALTRELAKAVTTGSIKSEEINDDLLSEKLKLGDVPDPDMAIIYGRSCSTYGVLPWHTKVTEFFMLPVCNRLSVKDFVDLLNKYSKCEQRFGK